MKIRGIRKKYLETAKKSLDNSSAWLNEANYLLFEKKSYGHSCALSIFSIEETAKALVCFSVVIGSADPEEELVKAAFESHYWKMGTILQVILHLYVPQLRKVMFSKLEEDELRETHEIYQKISPDLEESIKSIVKLRMIGMYVDLQNGKITDPESIPRDVAEGVFMLAFLSNRQWAEAINTYEAASQEEKMRRIESAKKITAQARENLKRLEQAGEKDEEL